MSISTCDWCGKPVEPENQDLCRRCATLAFHAMELARQVAIEVPKGGVQLYVALERTGQEHALLSVKRWSPLEPLEDVNYVEPHLSTFQ